MHEEEIREKIIDANDGITQYVKNSKDIFEALTKYNAKRGERSGPMGGRGVTAEAVKGREGVDQAQSVKTSKTITTGTNVKKEFDVNDI